MRETILNLGYIYGAFGVVYITNIILGLMQNVGVKKEAFNFSLIINSIVKLISNGVGLVLVAISFSFIERGISALVL